LTTRQPAVRRVHSDNFGAWMVKGNADRDDLRTRFARKPRVERWCVWPGYRARLMSAGQPVVFWASGNRRRDHPYGIWGIGRLTGTAREDADGWWVPLDLVISDRSRFVERAALRADPRLTDLEVLRQPQAANPSFLTVTEFAVVQGHAGLLAAMPRTSSIALRRPPRPSRRRP
jgi:hypothetical protein